MNLTAKDYRAMLEPIAEEDFIVDIFTDEVSKCCVIGHITRLTSKNPSDFSFKNCNDNGINFGANTFRNYCYKHGHISIVNNQRVYIYNQDTPKKRVIAFLDDMITAGL